MPTKKLSSKVLARLTAKWEAKLARDGLKPLGTGKHWTFPGVSCKGVGFTSINSYDKSGSGEDAFNNEDLAEQDAREAFPTDDGSTPTAADTPVGLHFRRLSQSIAALPPTYPGLAFLRAYVETGYVTKAAKAVRIKVSAGQAILTAAHVRFGYHQPGKVTGTAVKPWRDPDICHDCPRNALGQHTKHGPARLVPQKRGSSQR